MGTPLLTTRRPTGPVPANQQHEFLAEWIATDDPVLQAWVLWFQRSRIRHVVATHAMTMHGVTGTYAMLYTHRLIIPHRGGLAHWCCDE